MRYLAFDYGTQYSGIAVGGDISSSAEPLAPLAMNNGWADDEQLYKLVAEWSPDAFILGMPATPAQAKAEQAKTAQPINLAKRVHSFSAYLTRKFDRPCHFIDERLSSRVMEQKLRSMGLQPQAGTLDSMVACALLHLWLDNKNNNPVAHGDTGAGDGDDTGDGAGNNNEDEAAAPLVAAEPAPAKTTPTDAPMAAGNINDGMKDDLFG